MSLKRSRSVMSFDPYYVGSQASQIGYGGTQVGSSVRRAGTVRKRAARKGKDKGIASKDYVKRLLDSRIESKVANINSGGAFGTVLNETSMNAYPMMPLVGYWTIGQGVTQSTRVGNDIRVRKVILSYVIRPMAYNAGTNPQPVPCEIDMYLLYTKRAPSVRPTAGDFNNLYESGASSIPASGSLNDLAATVNKDYFSCHRWGHKVGVSVANGTAVSNVPQVQNQYYSNNDFKYNVVNRMDITKFIPQKKISFNDGDGTSFKNLFLCYQCVASDGTIRAAAEEMMHIDFWIRFEYEDA